MTAEGEQEGVTIGPDGRARCTWGDSTEDYRAYHDSEWGFPVKDDIRLFEKLVLEGFQSGLSWLTILRKRENFRRAFAHFDYVKVAEFGDADVARLLEDAGIVRHRGKILAAINNAGRAVELVAAEGGLAAYAWSFEPSPRGRPLTLAELRVQTTSPQSTRMAKDLKQRGWRFVGPTTVYAFMQAMGLVNDHLAGCHVQARAAQARSAFSPPAGRAPADAS